MNRVNLGYLQGNSLSLGVPRDSRRAAYNKIMQLSPIHTLAGFHLRYPSLSSTNLLGGVAKQKTVLLTVVQMQGSVRSWR